MSNDYITAEGVSADVAARNPHYPIPRPHVVAAILWRLRGCEVAA